MEHWGIVLEGASASIEQARRLSDIIHSENEWVSSIPDVQNKVSPVNVDLLEHLVSLENRPEAAEWVRSLQEVVERPITIFTLLHLVRLERKHRAKQSANAKHNKRGGSRDRKARLLKIWASGKYATRDLCAEKEHEGLGVSFPTARKHLRRTPKPPSHS